MLICISEGKENQQGSLPILPLSLDDVIIVYTLPVYVPGKGFSVAQQAIGHHNAPENCIASRIFGRDCYCDKLSAG